MAAPERKGWRRDVIERLHSRAMFFEKAFRPLKQVVGRAKQFIRVSVLENALRRRVESRGPQKGSLAN